MHSIVLDKNCTVLYIISNGTSAYPLAKKNIVCLILTNLLLRNNSRMMRYCKKQNPLGRSVVLTSRPSTKTMDRIATSLQRSKVGLLADQKRAVNKTVDNISPLWITPPFPRAAEYATLHCTAMASLSVDHRVGNDLWL